MPTVILWSAHDWAIVRVSTSVTENTFNYINNNTKIIQIKDEARKYAMGNDEGFW